MLSNTSTLPSLISCSGTHAVAVGCFGHLYVWGKNTVESPKTDNNASYEDEFCYKLGFKDPDFASIKEPVYFSLSHPLYKLQAVEVACGSHFTAVVAREKNNSSEQDSSDA